MPLRPPPPASAGPREWSPGWPYWLAAMVLLTAVVVAMQAVMHDTGGPFVYALDDAYIHMAMARNLAEHGVWGCTPFRFAAASSSPLWTALLGGVYALTGSHEITPLLLNLLLLLATLAVTDAVLQRAVVPPVVRAAALLALIVVVPMPAMALFGMEHVLHLLLTIAFATYAVRLLGPTSADTPSASPVAAAGLGALLVASRYEGLFLVAVVCALLAWHGQLRRACGLGAAALLPVAATGLYAVAHGSLFLPNSLMLKAGGEAASTWMAVLKPTGAVDLEALRTHPALLVLLLGSLALGLLEWWRAGTTRRYSVVLPLSVAAIVALHVHFELSSPFWVYRYDAYLFGLGLVTAALVAGGWARAATRGRAAVSAVVATALLATAALSGDPRATLYPAPEIASASLTFREHYDAARFVRAWHGGEPVLVNDLGVMAYAAAADPRDIFGLCDIEPVRLRRAADYTADAVERWTRPLGARLAVIQLSWGWAAAHVPSTWTKVAEVEVLPEHRVLGFFSTSADRGAVQALRAEVAYYYGDEAHRQHYRLHVF